MCQFVTLRCNADAVTVSEKCKTIMSFATILSAPSPTELLIATSTDTLGAAVANTCLCGKDRKPTLPYKWSAPGATELLIGTNTEAPRALLPTSTFAE